MGIMQWIYESYPEPQPPSGVQGLALIALSPLCHPNPTHQLPSDDPSHSDAPHHCADHAGQWLPVQGRPSGARRWNDVRDRGGLGWSYCSTSDMMPQNAQHLDGSVMGHRWRCEPYDGGRYTAPQG